MPLEICGFLFWCFTTVPSWNQDVTDLDLPHLYSPVTVYRVSNTSLSSIYLNSIIPAPLGFGPGPQVIVLVNVSAVGKGDIILPNNGPATGAIGSKPFATPNGIDCHIQPNGSIICWYDLVTGAWRTLSVEAGGSSATIGTLVGIDWVNCVCLFGSANYINGRLQAATGASCINP